MSLKRPINFGFLNLKGNQYFLMRPILKRRILMSRRPKAFFEKQKKKQIIYMYIYIYIFFFFFFFFLLRIIHAIHKCIHFHILSAVVRASRKAKQNYKNLI